MTDLLYTLPIEAWMGLCLVGGILHWASLFLITSEDEARWKFPVSVVMGSVGSAVMLTGVLMMFAHALVVTFGEVGG